MRNTLLAFSLITGAFACAPLLATPASAAPVLAAPMLQAASVGDGQAVAQPVRYYRHRRGHYRRHGYYRRY